MHDLEVVDVEPNGNDLAVAQLFGEDARIGVVESCVALVAHPSKERKSRSYSSTTDDVGSAEFRRCRVKKPALSAPCAARVSRRRDLVDGGPG